jgi:hypothetical protein
MHAIFMIFYQLSPQNDLFVPIFIYKLTLLNNYIIFPTIIHIVQWNKYRLPTFFYIHFHIFSKSNCLNCLKNDSSTSLIIITKYLRHLNGVFLKFLQYSLHPSLAWTYATCTMHLCIYEWSLIIQHHITLFFAWNNCHVHKFFYNLEK